MKNHLKTFAFIGIIAVCFAGLASCNSDDVKGNLYTFTEKMMGQYFETGDTTLTEFNKLLDLTKTKNLLNTYGYYTTFAPTNEAMRTFYKEKGKKSLEEFPADSLKQIVYDHIINGAVIMYAHFPNGDFLSLPSMSKHQISSMTTDSGKTYINKSLLIQKDIVVHNGVIHKLNKVLDPVRKGIVELISLDTDFSLFYSALEATGLADSLMKNVDESYSISAAFAKELEDAINTTITSERHAPTSREYGYTILMESNQTMAENNIHNLSELKEYAAGIYDQMYPEDKNITSPIDRRNSLNRFIAYHLMDKELTYSKFISNYDTNHQSKIVDLYEYIETMCPNTLLEVKIDRTTGETNIFNYNKDTNKAIRIVKGTKYNIVAENGVYHQIDNMLAYTPDVDANLSSKRLRFDFSSIFPELTNNNMRGRPSDNASALYRNALPKGYLERLQCTDQTVVCYSNAHDKLMNYEGDEVFLVVQSGKLYDFTVKLPPIPAGTYEIRFGYQSNGRRGVAQFYIDGIPTGVPVNLNTVGTDPSIGYVKPGNDADDLLGFLNDKMMRNRGYMKGPNSFKAINESWYAGSSARYNGSNLRKILNTYTFDKAEHHYLTVRGLSGGQFQIDFIEFVPTSAIESEDIN